MKNIIAFSPVDATGVAVPAEVTDLLAVSASDPLSLSADDIERSIAVITELVALQANWPEAVAETAGKLDELRDATRRATRAAERWLGLVPKAPVLLRPLVREQGRSSLGSRWLMKFV